jgi:hypothetical protein
LAVKVTDWQAEAAVGTIVGFAVIVGSTVLTVQVFVVDRIGTEERSVTFTSTVWVPVGFEKAWLSWFDVQVLVPLSTVHVY